VIEHKTKYRVPYGDVDRMGFLYHSHYLELFDIGRTEMMRSLGFSNLKLEESGYQMPVFKAEINYMRPALYDDLLEIRTQIQRMPEATVVFNYEIYRHVNPESDKLEEQPITTGKVRLAFMNPATKRAVRPPQFLKDLLSKYF